MCVLLVVTGVIREKGRMLSFCLRDRESRGEGFVGPENHQQHPLVPAAEKLRSGTGVWW